jgi:hypothetical protein
VFGIVVTVPAELEAPLSRAGLPCLDDLGGARFYLFCNKLFCNKLSTTPGDKSASGRLQIDFREAR